MVLQGSADLPREGRKGGARGTVDREDFDDRVKYLEAKFKGEPLTDKKPKVGHTSSLSLSSTSFSETYLGI